MPNPYFQFKQFTIHHDQCAMKVCTDACVFGAWFARKNLEAKEILDIGSGTGLLMLMLAQKTNSCFQGIEIDPLCFQQLKKNITHSAWADRIKIVEGDAREFSVGKKFDFIISNPPFHEKNLESESAEINIARHSKQLTLEELLTAIEKNLAKNGSFGILLPYYRVSHFEKIAQEKNFHLVERVLVKQSAHHEFFRGILHFSGKAMQNVTEKSLTIQESDGQYTEEFDELLKDYYLYLDKPISSDLSTTCPAMRDRKHRVHIGAT